MDEEYTVNEEKYATLKKEILDDSDSEEGSGGEEEEGDSDEENAEGGEEDKDKIVDKTETNMVSVNEI